MRTRASSTRLGRCSSWHCKDTKRPWVRETYIPALNTIWGLASLFERQSNPLEAGIMYSKALKGYEKAVGPDHPESKRLREIIRALDARRDNNVSEEAEGSPNIFQEEGSHLGARERPPKSRRQKLLNK